MDYHKLERLADAAHTASISLSLLAGAAAVEELNAILGPKGVFCEINKMGLCLRLGKQVDGLEQFPFNYWVAQLADYIEQELPDGTGFKVIKDRYCLTGQVLYKSSLG